MNKKLYYGRFDKTSFKSEQIKLEKIQTQADGSTNISMSGVKYFEIKEETQSITWGDLFHLRLHEFCDQSEIYQETLQEFPFYLGIVNSYLKRLWDSLKEECQKEAVAEIAFFELYCELCCYDEGQIAWLPALIPQVHINWECVSKKREEPCIVDFVFKSPKFGTNNLVIVEMDGASHYAEWDIKRRNYYNYLLRLAIINPPARKQEIFWLRLIAIKIVFRLILIATRLKLNANGLAIINLDSH